MYVLFWDRQTPDPCFLSFASSISASHFNITFDSTLLRLCQHKRRSELHRFAKHSHIESSPPIASYAHITHTLIKIMSTLSAGVMGVRQAGSTSESPVYDVPYGTVQIASSSKDASGNFDLAAGFTAPADYQDEDDDEEGDDDDGDSEDGKGKKKGKRGRSEAKGERDQKTGRRKIKIEFIDDDARRHITFSKRKAGIMKKAFELATLTGTQVLLLVVSQTGLVYTFTTPKLQALVTQAEGRNLIQACLNAPDPSGGVESGQEDQSGEEGSDADDGSSPSESQASSNKRAGANRKRPRTASTSKASSASGSAAAVATAGGEDEGASGSQLATAKRGRGRPRKNTAGAGQASAPAEAAHSMPPPPALHHSFGEDALRQQQHHQPQYTHVPSTDFPNYAAGGFYGDASSATGNHDLGFAQSAGLAVDANQAAWSHNMSPNNTQGMFSDPHHHQQPQLHQAPQQTQQQQQQAPQFNYAAQHYGHFNPQQLAMQSQEIQAPRPAW